MYAPPSRAAQAEAPGVADTGFSSKSSHKSKPYFLDAIRLDLKDAKSINVDLNTSRLSLQAFTEAKSCNRDNSNEATKSPCISEGDAQHGLLVCCASPPEQLPKISAVLADDTDAGVAEAPDGDAFCAGLTTPALVAATETRLLWLPGVSSPASVPAMSSNAGSPTTAPTLSDEQISSPCRPAALGPPIGSNLTLPFKLSRPVCINGQRRKSFTYLPRQRSEPTPGSAEKSGRNSWLSLSMKPEMQAADKSTKEVQGGSGASETDLHIRSAPHAVESDREQPKDHFPSLLRNLSAADRYERAIRPPLPSPSSLPTPILFGIWSQASPTPPRRQSRLFPGTDAAAPADSEVEAELQQMPMDHFDRRYDEQIDPVHDPVHCEFPDGDDETVADGPAANRSSATQAPTWVGGTMVRTPSATYHAQQQQTLQQRAVPGKQTQAPPQQEQQPQPQQEFKHPPKAAGYPAEGEKKPGIKQFKQAMRSVLRGVKVRIPQRNSANAT
ncbi:hypothetical protein K437DRAFT_133156 [Tilletiaria anomala UBC 951]|uniref:Uncharacterized protein n=1 Tax=Tilletiaria anomala (strain ATCC 24038 / CBS 436.72 / UBC 951) TaxID=1037660 RepID=A0A066WQN6_TILAU|nr:uncharacterized protein K437DRAFT_133156 [Tilletiaria anomala UBC 951]KDN52945.1 hypothetical protein K437DRAFT_133156 [Tilletiaria anomala UBC 951]